MAVQSTGALVEPVMAAATLAAIVPAAVVLANLAAAIPARAAGRCAQPKSCGRSEPAGGGDFPVGLVIQPSP